MRGVISLILCALIVLTFELGSAYLMGQIVGAYVNALLQPLLAAMKVL